MGGPKGKSVALGEERSAGASRSHSGGGGKASFLDADASGESKNESTFRDLFRASFFSKIRPAPHSSKTGMRFNLVKMAKIQPTNGQHSANIQSTFSQHSANIQPTSANFEKQTRSKTLPGLDCLERGPNAVCRRAAGRRRPRSSRSPPTPSHSH